MRTNERRPLRRMWMASSRGGRTGQGAPGAPSKLLLLNPSPDHGLPRGDPATDGEGRDLALCFPVIDAPYVRWPPAVLRAIEENRDAQRADKQVVGQGFIVRAHGARCIGMHRRDLLD